ncbi:aldose 1-epimerase [Paenibacillus athensensis]|uniref:Aldose 1-epimerase n=1 Tax=Paenibacillus athensensis TaxID=1967502 RepID=A0A4Y8Q280_9BACL|nr:aldose 1-epimerase [Paenibacillus athensensis]MCD1260648.1 aldose 1-epimerase [Paenibacillus athensensis]
MSRYAWKERTWDGAPTLVLIDRDAEIEVEIVPSVGFNLFRYEVQGEPYIAAPSTLAELRAATSRYGVPILCPPGRVRNGSYTFEGREYRLPINREPDHAHGQLRDQAWHLVERGANETDGAYAMAVLKPAQVPDVRPYWPHHTELRLIYRVRNGELLLEGSIHNRSAETMPLALGFHPYFAVGKEEAARTRVVLPAAREWPLGPDGFAAGPPQPSALSDALRSGVAVTELPAYPGGSQMFSLAPEGGVGEVRYGARGTRLVFAFGDRFPIHVLFTAPWTGAVSLEPYTAIMNAFNEPWPAEMTGAQGLKAGETFRFGWSLRVEPWSE